MNGYQDELQLAEQAACETYRGDLLLEVERLDALTTSAAGQVALTPGSSLSSAELDEVLWLARLGFLHVANMKEPNFSS